MTAALQFAAVAVWTPATVKAARPEWAAKKYGAEDPGEVSDDAPGLAVACSTSLLAEYRREHKARGFNLNRAEVWQVVHAASGYIVGLRRTTRHAARLGAIGLAKLGDWTRPIAEIRADFSMIEMAKQVVTGDSPRVVKDFCGEIVALIYTERAG